MGIKVVALTGRSGGRLRSLADVCIAVPEDETFKIQELHLPVYHALCLAVEAAKARGMRVAGVVHNYHPGVDATIDADTVAAVRRQLARLGFPPVVVTVPKVEPGRLPDVDFSELFP